MSKKSIKENEIQFANDFVNRLIELRTSKKVSAREMSLSIGQSAGYINRIENKHMMPSLPIFINICEYLEVSPSEFLSFCDKDNNAETQLLRKIHRLPTETILHLELLVRDLIKNV